MKNKGGLIMKKNNNVFFHSIVRKNKGFSFLDVAISVTVLTLLVIAVVSALNNIIKGVQKSKNQTYASNLAQSKIEEEKNKAINSSWGDVVTGTTSETISFNNKSFTRQTELAYYTESGGDLISSATATDLIRIAVTITWTEESQTKTLTMTNFVSNRSSSVDTGSITGWVKNTSGDYLDGSGGRPQATIKCDGYPNYITTMGATSYTLDRIADGTYTVRATAQGYQDATSTVTITNSVPSPSSTNLSLTAVATANITFYVVGAASNASHTIRVSCNDGVSTPQDFTSDASGNIGSAGSPQTFSTVKDNMAGLTLTAMDMTTSDTGTKAFTITASVTTPTPVDISSLSGAPVKGYLSGTVKDDQNNPINTSPYPLVTVSDGESPSPNKNCAAGGSYPASGNLEVLPGTWTATASFTTTPPSYKDESQTVTISASTTTTQNFTLTRVGSISGQVTSSGTGVSGLTITAIGDGGTGTVEGSAVTDSSGNYTINYLPVGNNNYTVQVAQPALYSDYTSSPTEYTSVTVSTGTTVTGKNFTVTNSVGYIAGYVRTSGTLITSGILIYASSGTLPTITDSLGPNNPPPATLYSTISGTDGYYVLKVPAGATATTYNIRAVYTRDSNFSSSSSSTVSVANTNTSASPASKDFSF
jgi:Tfp pilus assembly protein PilV